MNGGRDRGREGGRDEGRKEGRTNKNRMREDSTSSSSSSLLLSSRDSRAHQGRYGKGRSNSHRYR